MSADPEAHTNTAAPIKEPPRTGDPSVDAILTDFVAQSGGSRELSERIDAAAVAHRQLSARLSADREH